MKAQTLFLIASTLCGALAAPVRGREAKVVTVFENVVHVVTVTSTSWVKASEKPTLVKPTTVATTTTEEYEEETSTSTTSTQEEYPTITSTSTYDTTTTTATTSVEEPTTTYTPEITSTYVSPEPTETEAPEEEEPETTQEEEIETPTSTYTTPTSTPTPEPETTTEAPEPETTAVAPVPVDTPKPVTVVAPEDVTESVAPEGEYTTGEATFYDTGMGSCGAEHTDDEYVVAISKEIMMKYDTGNPNNNPLCGKRIKCMRGEKEVIATVVDTCPGCTPGHVDLSRASFKDLGEFDEGNIPITWYWMDPIDE